MAGGEARPKVTTLLDGSEREGGAARWCCVKTERERREAITIQPIGEDEREKEPRGGERVLPAKETGVGWWLGRRQETMVAAVRTETGEEENDKKFERTKNKEQTEGRGCYRRRR